MVAVKSGLREVSKTMVTGYLAGRQVTVIVIDRHLLCVFVIEIPGGFGLQQEIFCYKLLGHLLSSYILMIPED